METGWSLSSTFCAQISKMDVRKRWVFIRTVIINVSIWSCTHGTYQCLPCLRVVFTYRCFMHLSSGGPIDVCWDAAAAQAQLEPERLHKIGAIYSENVGHNTWYLYIITVVKKSDLQITGTPSVEWRHNVMCVSSSKIIILNTSLYSSAAQSHDPSPLSFPDLRREAGGAEIPLLMSAGQQREITWLHSIAAQEGI